MRQKGVVGGGGGGGGGKQSLMTPFPSPCLQGKRFETPYQSAGPGGAKRESPCVEGANTALAGLLHRSNERCELSVGRLCVARPRGEPQLDLPPLPPLAALPRSSSQPSSMLTMCTIQSGSKQRHLTQYRACSALYKRQAVAALR